MQDFDKPQIDRRIPMNISHHSFSIDLAKKFGIDESIMIEYISYWIDFNIRTGKKYSDDRHWMYQKQEDIAAHFPYWTKRQVERILKSLKTKGIIVMGNFNKSSFDRTGWYSINYEMITDGIGGQ
jgi:hypothetical protein